MNDKNQPDISNSTQKLPYHKTPEAIAKRKAREQTPEYKARRRAYQQTYEQSLKGKSKIQNYRQSSEYKVKRRAREQTPEFKAKRKIERQSPEAKAKHKAWREANPEKIFKLNKKHYKKRHERDSLYVSKCILRSTVWHAFKRIGKNKPADTQTLLGCDWKEAKAHFESLFKEGMTWDNHGIHGWHIDHIRPVSSFKEDELHLMNHISNLQPLWAHENLEKSDKIL